MRPATIYPVSEGGKLHAAFRISVSEERWATRCGLAIPASQLMTGGMQYVTCPECIDQLDRAARAREAMGRLEGRTAREAQARGERRRAYTAALEQARADLREATTDLHRDALARAIGALEFVRDLTD